MLQGVIFRSISLVTVDVDADNETENVKSMKDKNTTHTTKSTTNQGNELLVDCSH